MENSTWKYKTPKTGVPLTPEKMWSWPLAAPIFGSGVFGAGHAWHHGA